MAIQLQENKMAASLPVAIISLHLSVNVVTTIAKS